jgi:hypothetical protein
MTDAERLAAACGGTWGTCPAAHPHDWMLEIAEGNTRLGYWEWACVQLEGQDEPGDRDTFVPAPPDTGRAVTACRALVEAYDWGGLNGKMDWSHVDVAHLLACEALGIRRE